ncbi:hypothetical protein ACQ86N_19070 [Puia sp. P3]|uniref:hypothetical protein n=1 Tax=Puia sp. P3 TaxID=3423952 RepID=UPI003D668DA4
MDALRFTGRNKKELLWEGDLLQKKTRDTAPATHLLFREAPKSFTLPDLPVHEMEQVVRRRRAAGIPRRRPLRAGRRRSVKVPAGAGVTQAP